MPETLSIIHSDGEPRSVAAEQKRNSDWVKQEAQLLMDELFVDVSDDLDLDGEILTASLENQENWDSDLLPPPQKTGLPEQEWFQLQLLKRVLHLFAHLDSHFSNRRSIATDPQSSKCHGAVAER